MAELLEGVSYTLLAEDLGAAGALDCLCGQFEAERAGEVLVEVHSCVNRCLYYQTYILQPSSSHRIILTI